MTCRNVLSVCLGLLLLVVGVAAPSAQAAFGIQSASVDATNSDGSLDFQAGSHPFAYTVNVTINQNASHQTEGLLRGLVVNLPPGVIGNPQALPECSRALFSGTFPHCPGNTQVGVATAVTGFRTVTNVPVFLLAPNPGSPAALGFSLLEFDSLQNAAVRSGSDYGVSINDDTIPTELEVKSISETIWGVPQDPAHDELRVCQTPAQTKIEGCATDLAPAPFLTLPTSCSGPLTMTVQGESLEEPGVLTPPFEVQSLDAGGAPAGLSGCEKLPFAPTFTAQPEATAADSPTGLSVNLGIPQNESPEQLASAHLDDTVVTLPRGVVVNPSAADGLAGCSEAQIALHDGAVANCPAASKIGSVSIGTPLLDHQLNGAVYLARQGENPFHSLLALYIAVEDPITGVVVKLAGQVEPDAVTGQLKASFLENPQLPFESLKLNFFGGPRATLTTPPTCGTYATSANLTPWSSPAGPSTSLTDSFQVTSGAAGAGCPGTEAQMPNRPAFEAGTVSPVAGAYSPFVLKVSRENGSQRITAIDATLPRGLLGRLAGIPYCPESGINTAGGRTALGQGAVEQAGPSCPAASEVGSVTVGAGSGAPFYVGGHVYLAGPYKGAPLSLEIITPAVAGPFDLGVVAVRTALYVEPFTAQIRAESDQLPAILDGIPLDIRSIALRMDRPQFTLNPTSCDSSSVLASTTTSLGQVAPLQSRFQVGGCKGLEFKPKLQLSLKGARKRTGHPALKAVVTYPKGSGYANIARAQVGLPHSEFLDQGHIRTICSQADLKAATCPKASIYGKATAYTPLLEKPLTGPVYLAGGFGYKLPALVAELNGQIRILLKGKVDSDKQQGIRNTFEAVPDAPVSKFILEMRGGKRGLLENSTNICKGQHKAEVRFTAQSGTVDTFKAPVKASCGKKK